MEEQQLRPELPPVPLDAIDDDDRPPLQQGLSYNPTRPGCDYSGNGPLHWAAHGGYINIVNLLLAAGSDPFFKNRKGQLPMDLAREEGHHDICIRLQSATLGGEKAAKEYQRLRLGNTLHATTMQERVNGRDLSSSEEEEEEVEIIKNDKNVEDVDELDENGKVIKKEKTMEEIREEEDRQNIQFMIHPLCGECNQTNWATREKLLNKDTGCPMDRTKKLVRRNFFFLGVRQFNVVIFNCRRLNYNCYI